jgi:hypothetical protein
MVTSMNDDNINLDDFIKMLIKHYCQNYKTDY